MRWSQTFIPTLREDPGEAEIASHKLMIRAGLARRLAGGLYTFLPMGLRSLHKIQAIIREEMDRAGAIEVLMPALQPREIWDQSGRYSVMGDVMFRLRDRQGRDMVLGPTHEEAITDLVSREIKSYRQLPRTFYQIQTKFRDEIRPRFGLMRAREFVMKDAYSFDTSLSEADKSYQAMYDAYCRIFERCGLRTKIVEADTGAMGGKWSHEFMVLADAGEDGLVECSSCSYAANLEKAERSVPENERPASSESLREVSTPGMRTIEQVSSFLGCPASALIKTLIYVADGKPVAALVPGDRDINERKLQNALEASVLALADEPTILRVTGAPVGFAGPIGLSIPVIADASVKNAANRVVGANRADTHMVNFDIARDASVSEFRDLVVARGGDACPRCGSPLSEKRGIEVGHVFKLGTKYSKAFGAEYLDENGQRLPIIMGCYGIGVTRTLQAVIEQLHDENGIIWPASVAPCQVVIVPLGSTPAATQAVESLAASLEQADVDYIVDDRQERAGVKFKDADLVGFPVRVVISDKSLPREKVEIKARSAASPLLVSPCDAVQTIRNLLSQAPGQRQ